MKPNKLLYIILAIVVVFLIIYNFKLLEGYTYLPDMDLSMNYAKKVMYGNLTLAQCSAKCTKPGCLAFTSLNDLNADSTFRRDCTLYYAGEGSNNTNLNLARLQNLTYKPGTNLYIN